MMSPGFIETSGAHGMIVRLARSSGISEDALFGSRQLRGGIHHRDSGRFFVKRLDQCILYFPSVLSH
jgi:hypothetical protein